MMTHSWPLLLLFFNTRSIVGFYVHFTVGPSISFLEIMVLYFHFTLIFVWYSGKGDLFKSEKKKE